MQTPAHPSIDGIPGSAKVRDFRQRLNGYRAVRVRTSSKQPLGLNWQFGETTERLLDVGCDALNTGILAAGLRCIDVDVDNPPIASAIKAKILAHFPGAIIRVRANSSRFAVVVRAAEGEPGKRWIAGTPRQIRGSGGRAAVCCARHARFWRFDRMGERARTGYRAARSTARGDGRADHHVAEGMCIASRADQFGDWTHGARQPLRAAAVHAAVDRDQQHGAGRQRIRRGH